mgnify:CR=1 FL=1
MVDKSSTRCVARIPLTPEWPGLLFWLYGWIVTNQLPKPPRRAAIAMKKIIRIA